jgi:Fe-Mn family superoxide dismutase
MVKSYADPNLRPLSYYASQAYTNQFFFESLDASVNPNAQVAPPTEDDRNVDISMTLLNAPRASDPDHGALLKAIEGSFNDVVTLKELLVNRADAMFGNGYVWLVCTRRRGTFNPNHSLYVLNTYNYDTPFSRDAQAESDTQDASSSFGQASSQAVTNMVPLLNINAWQHVYLTDYGVAGKRKFLENAFNCINWDIVVNRLPSSTPIFKR